MAKTGELKKLTAQIRRYQGQIDQVNSEITLARPKAPPPPPATVSSFEQWFNNYGKPKPSPQGFLTVVQDDPKIYGGTSHHAGFKTQAKMMRRGRLTR